MVMSCDHSFVYFRVQLTGSKIVDLKKNGKMSQETGRPSKVVTVRAVKGSRCASMS